MMFQRSRKGVETSTAGGLFEKEQKTERNRMTSRRQTMNRSRIGFLFLVVALVFLGLAFAYEGSVYSEDANGELMAAPEPAASSGELIKPSFILNVKPAQLRTAEEIAEADAAMAGVEFGEEVPFMPTDDPAEYEAAKLAAESFAAQAARPVAPQPQAPPFQQLNFEGDVQQNAFPPDTHGAVGPSHVVEITNTRLRITNKAGGFLQTRTLQALFGSTEFIFDPRVVYDQTWQRWVIVASRRSVSNTDPVLRFFLAVSRTNSPTGAYFVYFVNFFGGPFNAGDWWDFPQLGMNQDAVVITGNIFDVPAGGFKFAALMPIAKARIYNGLGFGVPVFTGLAATLAPPIVLDQNDNTYFVAANNFTHLHLYRGVNLSNPPQAALFFQAFVDVPDYAIPPSAPQLGTVQRLDTLDRRFVNASTQVGDSLINAHTIVLGGLPTPKFYDIDTEGVGANTVKQQGFFFEGGVSNDFNVSIAANASRELFVTWNTTDVANAIVGFRHNARIRISGKQPADAGIPAGTAVFTSAAALTGNPSSTVNVQRWGDYSAVSLDPSGTATCAANRRAWYINEKVNNAATWGSRFGRFGFCN
jgi:hypothetical protein